MQQGAQLAFGPEASPQVRLGKQRHTGSRSGKSVIHLTGKTLPGADGHLVEPDCDAEGFKLATQLFGYIGSVDTCVTEEDVVLALVLLGDGALHPVDKVLLFHRKRDRRAAALPELGELLTVVSFGRAVVVRHSLLDLTLELALGPLGVLLCFALGASELLAHGARADPLDHWSSGNH
nr:hypothetical protein [Streptomyces tailanensis]